MYTSSYQIVKNSSLSSKKKRSWNKNNVIYVIFYVVLFTSPHICSPLFCMNFSVYFAILNFELVDARGRLSRLVRISSLIGAHSHNLKNTIIIFLRARAVYKVGDPLGEGLFRRWSSLCTRNCALTPRLAVVDSKFRTDFCAPPLLRRSNYVFARVARNRDDTTMAKNRIYDPETTNSNFEVRGVEEGLVKKMKN